MPVFPIVAPMSTMVLASSFSRGHQVFQKVGGDIMRPCKWEGLHWFMQMKGFSICRMTVKHLWLLLHFPFIFLKKNTFFFTLTPLQTLFIFTYLLDLRSHTPQKALSLISFYSHSLILLQIEEGSIMFGFASCKSHLEFGSTSCGSHFGFPFTTPFQNSKGMCRIKKVGESLYYALTY